MVLARSMVTAPQRLDDPLAQEWGDLSCDQVGRLAAVPAQQLSQESCLDRVGGGHAAYSAARPRGTGGGMMWACPRNWIA